MYTLPDKIAALVFTIEDALTQGTNTSVVLVRLYAKLLRLAEEVASAKPETAPVRPDGYFCISLHEGGAQGVPPREAFFIKGYLTTSKILAIKRVRQDALEAGRDCGLKDAKDFVDSLQRGCRIAEKRCVGCGRSDACDCSRRT